jgi:RNA polymerase sigma-70 factor (ECF subfamily)
VAEQLLFSAPDTVNQTTRVRIMEMFRAMKMRQESDGALVTAAKRGNARAFEDLFLLHGRRVFAVAQRITNNREDAEDVVQETFRKVFLHLDDFQEKSRFSTWLIRIAMNEAFMLVRRRRAVVETLSENTEDGAKSLADPFVDQSPNPEEAYWRRERSELLTGAINRLGPKMRRAILLRDIEGRSVEETAELLGSSRSAVKARVFQGRRKLHRMVNRLVPREFSSPLQRSGAATGI